MKYVLFILGLVLPVSAVVCVNLFVDPHNVFRDTFTPDAHERFASAWTLRKKAAPAVFIGTSRTLAMRPEYFKEAGEEKAVNVLITAGSIYEMRRYFEYAQTVRPLNVAIIELSNLFYDNPVSVDFDEDLLPAAKPAHLEDWFRYNAAYVKGMYSALLSPRSFLFSFLGDKKWQDTTRMETHIRKYYAKKEAPAPPRKPSASAVENLAAILDTAEKNGTTVMFYFPPLLAEYQEFKYGPHWKAYQQSQQDMARVVMERNERSDVGFSVWEFSDFNTIVSSGFPKDGSFRNNAYYYDKAHYKQSVGKLMFDRMMRRCADPCPIPADFGKELTPGNILQILRKKDMDRAAFLKRNPGLDELIKKYVD